MILRIVIVAIREGGGTGWLAAGGISSPLCGSEVSFSCCACARMRDTPVLFSRVPARLCILPIYPFWHLLFCFVLICFFPFLLACFFDLFLSTCFYQLIFIDLFLFLFSRWSFQDIPLICSCPADHMYLIGNHVLLILLDMIESRSMMN